MERQSSEKEIISFSESSLNNPPKLCVSEATKEKALWVKGSSVLFERSPGPSRNLFQSITHLLRSIQWGYKIEEHCCFQWSYSKEKLCFL